MDFVIQIFLSMFTETQKLVFQSGWAGKRKIPKDSLHNCWCSKPCMVPARMSTCYRFYVTGKDLQSQKFVIAGIAQERLGALMKGGVWIINSSVPHLLPSLFSRTFRNGMFVSMHGTGKGEKSAHLCNPKLPPLPPFLKRGIKTQPGQCGEEDGFDVRSIPRLFWVNLLFLFFYFFLLLHFILFSDFLSCSHFLTPCLFSLRRFDPWLFVQPWLPHLNQRKTKTLQDARPGPRDYEAGCLPTHLRDFLAEWIDCIKSHSHADSTKTPTGVKYNTKSAFLFSAY